MVYLLVFVLCRPLLLVVCLLFVVLDLRWVLMLCFVAYYVCLLWDSLIFVLGYLPTDFEFGL